MYEEKKRKKKEKKFFKVEQKAKKEPREKKVKVKKEKMVKEETPKKILTLKADYVSILVKLGLFLAIAFVVIFTITKIKNNSEKNTFTSNMEKMKEVAYMYYKVESHRPIVVTEEVTMTLEDMIDGSLIEELVDKKKNVCSREYSYVSLMKKNDENYEMKVYLSCGGEAKSATYDIIYTTKKEESNNKEQTILYELKRTITTNEKYSCPEGYESSGELCIKLNATKIMNAVPKYKITPEKNTLATYKKSKNEYEYTNPIVTEKEEIICQKNSTLINGKCLIIIDAKYKTEKEYTCPNGGTIKGTKCLFTTYPQETTRKAYCKEGSLINDKCYITKKYSVKCLTGTKDSAKNACYVTYNAKKELSDWMFSGKVTYSESKNVIDSETLKYEIDEYLENGKVVYKKYIRKKINVCDNEDILSGSTCKHYDETYEQRTCSANYILNKEESECYTYKDASYKKIEETYLCPQGYNKKGNKEEAICYKYEPAVKKETKNAYCSSGYELNDNKCIKEVNAENKENKTYTCPDGYTKSGNGKYTKCYKKTEKEGYYYCQNKNAYLENDRCIIKEKTTFLGYRCPSGYNLSGNVCIKNDAKETIYATKNEGKNEKEETIWSKTKELEGWTWTGNTKIEEISR